MRWAKSRRSVSAGIESNDHPGPSLSGLGAIGAAHGEPYLPARLDKAQKSIDWCRMRLRRLTSLFAFVLAAIAVVSASAPAHSCNAPARPLAQESSAVGKADAIGHRATGRLMSIALAAGEPGEQSVASLVSHKRDPGHIPCHDHGPGHDCGCCPCAATMYFLLPRERADMLAGSAPRRLRAFDDAARHAGVSFSLLRPPRISA